MDTRTQRFLILGFEKSWDMRSREAAARFFLLATALLTVLAFCSALDTYAMNRVHGYDHMDLLPFVRSVC